MWETLISPSRGSFSLPKMARTFLAAFITACLLTIFSSVAAHAADASWQDDGTILYNGKTYAQQTSPSGVNAAPGSTIYVSRDESQRTASVIVIPPNTDQTKEMGNIEVTNYTIAQDGSLTNAQRPPNGTITLDAKPAPKNKTQCDVAGVGWIVCVVSRFIADGMDNIFGIIAAFLEVKPISSDQNSGLFKAWSVALGIANMMFILAFLAIIYSHLTSYGISNYDIKKMIPKLIVSAVLVNISFYICAVAVDISNILGYSVQQALIDIRKSLPDPVAGSMDSFSWKNITEYVLSGGTIVAGAFAAKAAFLGGTVGGSISGLSFLLLPALVAGALAVLIALLVLAARQALITVLIVVAPLAFVAYLLPNTEKWFEKWRELFMTMLLVFPLFSLLFGGSQLASYIIINNADQLSVVIFAMFIQVAPLAITPFLVKFSGSLLGRLAGMVNNPSKGIVDRTRGWASERAEVQRAKGLEAAAKGRGTMFQRGAFNRELERNNRESWKKRGESHVDAAWHNDRRYRAHHESIGGAELRKASGEAIANRHFEHRKSADRNLRRYVANQRLNDDMIKNMQTATEADWQEMKSKDYTNNPNNQFASVMSANAIARAQATKLNDQAQAYRQGTAEAMHKIEYANAVNRSSSLAKLAGGIDVDGGADSARAAAVMTLKKSRDESTAEGRALYEHYNLSSGQRQDLARGLAVTGVADDGTTRTFTPQDSKYVVRAAVEQQVTYGTLEERQELILKSGGSLNGPKGVLYEHRELIADSMVKGNIGQIANNLGGNSIDDVRAGRMDGTEKLLMNTLESIAKGKMSAQQLLNQDKVTVETYVEAVRRFKEGSIHINGQLSSDLHNELDRLYDNTRRALTDERINAGLGERKNALEELVRMGDSSTPPSGP